HASASRPTDHRPQTPRLVHHLVPVRNLIEAPKTLSWAPSADWPTEPRRLGALNVPRTRTGPRDGRLGRAVGRYGAYSTRVRRRADTGDEVRRPAGSRRCPRSLTFALCVDGGCCCGGTDAGGWRCSTRDNCAADVGDAVR